MRHSRTTEGPYTSLYFLCGSSCLGVVPLVCPSMVSILAINMVFISAEGDFYCKSNNVFPSIKTGVVLPSGAHVL